MTVTLRQIRAARQLLGWHQDRLAAFADVNIATVTRFERHGRISEKMAGRLAAVLEKHGIEFVTTGRRKGVILVERGPVI